MTARPREGRRRADPSRELYVAQKRVYATHPSQLGVEEFNGATGLLPPESVSAIALAKR